MDETNKFNQEQTDLQGKKQNFPRVLQKRLDDGKLHIMRRVKEPQQPLNDGTLSHNVDSKKLEIKKQGLDKPKVVFKKACIKIPGLAAKLASKLSFQHTELTQQKHKTKLKPVQQNPANKVEIPSNKSNLKIKTNSDFEESPKTSKMDGKNDVSDISSILTENTRKRKGTDINKKEELKTYKPKKEVVVKEPLVAKLLETFNQIVENIIQSTSNNDSSKIGQEEIIKSENLLNCSIMEQLVNESAKLKSSGTTKSIPIDKLFCILNVMELNIRGGDKISPSDKGDSASKEQMKRVLGAADACLVCLYVMTSPNMPKRIYIEDVINRVILCIKHQLENIIFPAFDSTYVVENKKSDGTKKKMQTPEDGIKLLLDKSLELINLLTEFLKIQLLTDALVLEVSFMAISSFFVKNIEKLQAKCTNLITTTFTRYEKHRRLMLEQILVLTTRVPNTKCNLHTYKFGKENIHVLTALILLLIQSVTSISENLANEVFQGVNAKKVNKDNLLCNKYEKATNIAGTFLTMFLNQCTNKSEDANHKPLFENFIQDLISTVNKPKWPASVLFLTLLGRILVKRISDEEAEVFSRVISLDYLSLIVAWLRKSAILMQDKINAIDQIVEKVKGFEKKQNVDSKEEKVQLLQEILLDFLAEKGKNDQMVQDARLFCIARWYNDATDQVNILLGDEAIPVSSQTITKNTRKRKRGQDGTDVKVLNTVSLSQDTAEKYRKLEARKKLFLQKIQSCNEFKFSKNCRNNIDYGDAELITQYLVSDFNNSENFDRYLKRILIILKEPEAVIQTKTLKCLSLIIVVDPLLLARNDIQIIINCSFLDSAPSVREAAVDLIGKFVLNRPELLDKYYELLSARILDTNTGVRKKVIKILRDVCVANPDFSKFTEICVKIIRRVNDEGGVGKLVVDVFQNMWFTPENKSSLLCKVMNIADIVAAFKHVGLEWFQQLLENLFKPKEDKFGSTKIQKEPPKPVLLASTQIINCLIENMLKLGETHNANSNSLQRLVSYSTTLYLFAKIQPRLLVNHAEIIQSFLNLKCHSKEDVQVISNTALILALIVPIIPNPHHTFLAQLQQDCLKLVLLRDRPVVVSSLTCLGSIINNVTRNFNLVRECFLKYYDYLVQIKLRITLEKEKNVMSDVKYRQYFKRALFVVGLLIQHFDFNDKEVIGDLPEDIINQVFEVFLFYLQQKDEDIQVNAIKAVGCLCTRHEFILEKRLKAFYQHIMTSDDSPLAVKSEVLINIESYLGEEDQRMMQEDLKWKARSKQENLKKMDDQSSGKASIVIQEYLKEILESYLNLNIQVREPALRVVQLILQQGLVHPVQIVPYLICMSTDCEKMVSHGADKQLLELEKRYPGLIHTKASLGIKLSYQLQKILQDVSIIRGFGLGDEAEYPISLNGYLYSILRSSRQQRRGLVLNMLKQFDVEHISLSYMLYLADNLAYFPYMVQDEPLFIINHIDMMISVSGTNLLQSFREGLIRKEPQGEQLELSAKDLPIEVSALDEDDDKEGLLTRVPEDTSILQGYLTAAQGCLLLLMLKQHFKDVYGLSDGKIRQYSPGESAKIHEKPLSRRSNKHFYPTTTVSKLQGDFPSSNNLDEEGRENLINQYLEFKQLMLKLDREDNDENRDGEIFKTLNSLSSDAKSASALNTVLVESEQVKSNKSLNAVNKGKSRKSQAPRKSKTPKKKKKRKMIVASSDDKTGGETSDSDFLP